MKFASQSAYSVRFEWGEYALDVVHDPNGVAIIIDVLSFTTCVDIACARGAKVFPFPYRDERAAIYAQGRGATVAKRRGEDGSSLSPLSLLTIDREARLVLPSPNGSSLSSRTSAGVIMAGCMRNIDAVARIALETRGPITVVAAGERWPDGSLRAAIEDYLCAGAVIDAVVEQSAVERLRTTRSPEAEVAAAAFRGVRSSLSRVVGGCASALELQASGFARDVELALEVNCSGCVPVLTDGAYQDGNSKT